MSFVRSMNQESRGSMRLVIAAALGLVVGMTGCSGDSSPGPSGGSGSSASTSAVPESVASQSSADSTEPATSESGDNKPEAAPGATIKSEAEPVVGGTGSVTGMVVFDGTFAALPLLHAAGAAVKDAEVCAKHDVADESLVVNLETGNGIANVFIYLPKLPSGAQSAPVPDEPVVFDQNGCRFVPHALVSRAGQTILIKSDDAVPHNVHTYARFQEPFNQICPPNEKNGLKLVYEKPEREPVEVKCDIHPWMRAYHLPVDHSFAAVSDASGGFTIEGLPAGIHKFYVWHEKAKFIDKALEVTVKAGEASKVTIKVKADQLAATDTRAERVVATAQK